MTTKQIINFTLCLLLILFAAELSTAQKPELVVQTGHSDFIRAVRFSPDGKLLASGGDSTIKLWDVATGRNLRTMHGSAYIESIAFSPDGKLVAGSMSVNIVLWDVDSGRELQTLKGQSLGVFSIAFSPDGKILAGGYGGGAIKLWDVATGRELRTLEGHSSTVNTVAFSPNGKVLASGSGDRTIRLWDFNTGREVRTLQVQIDFQSVAFSKDGKTMAGGGYSLIEDKPAVGEIKLWDTSSWQELHTLNADTGISSVAFSPDDMTLASDDDHKIKLWNIATGRELSTLEGHAGRVSSVAFAPDGKMLASGGNAVGYEAGEISLWDVSSGLELRTLKGYPFQVDSVALSPNGRIVATSGGDKTIKLWELATDQGPRTLKGNPGVIGPLAFSPDGTTMASASDDNKIRLWDVATGRELRTLEGHSERVNTVAFSPDGRILASGSQDTTIKLWDTDTGREIRTLEVHFHFVTSLVFSPNGKILASGNDSDIVQLSNKGTIASINTSETDPMMATTISLWDVATGRELKNSRLGYLVSSVAFSPDGDLLATGGGDALIVLWSSVTGNKLRTLEGHSGRVTTVAFSPDGQELLSGSSDKTLKLWSVADGHELRTLNGHSDFVTSGSFSSSGHVVVSGSWDGTVKLWESATGKELLSLTASDDKKWLAITPDGLFDGSLTAWNKIIWRFNNNTFDHAPVEAFFGDFYYPSLLADIFAGKRPKALSDISQKDRRQPQLNLALADGQTEAKFATRNVTAKIEVSELAADKNHKTGSGAQDVRLFRNGSLVKVWRGDVLKGQTSVTLEATIPIVAGENRLTAYAFNHDNIKSEDVSLTVTGADSLKRKGTLHILAVGVSQYANPEYNLNYTTDDATSFATQLKLQQEKLVQENLAQKKIAGYESVEIKTLLNEGATKANILAELKKLAGTVQPEDAVVVYFSGHGKASGDHFYLVPHDLGYNGSRDQLSSEGLKTILAHSISDQELEEAFRDIDAGQMFMIIDACNSGQALENKDEPRRGPMNTRGLAQLAYEKGMYIMTASQNVEEAFVSERLKHSYLTFALVEEGLKTKAADADHNGEVTLREWFDYALARVPKLREEVLQTKSLEEVTPKMNAARNQKSQTPRVFYRREAEQQPLIVARP